MRKTINKTWKGWNFGSALVIILFTLVFLAGGARAADETIGGCNNQRFREV